MDWNGKVWGETASLFCQNNIEIHYINANKGGYCSKHHHVHKYNKFVVLKGKLLVRIWKDYGLVDETVLNAHHSCEVPPGSVHQFEALEDTEALEIYWTEIAPSDIIRENVGGSNNQD